MNKILIIVCLIAILFACRKEEKPRMECAKIVFKGFVNGHYYIMLDNNKYFEVSLQKYILYPVGIEVCY